MVTNGTYILELLWIYYYYVISVLRNSIISTFWPGEEEAQDSSGQYK